MTISMYYFIDIVLTDFNEKHNDTKSYNNIAILTAWDVSDENEKLRKVMRIRVVLSLFKPVCPFYDFLPIYHVFYKYNAMIHSVKPIVTMTSSTVQIDVVKKRAVVICKITE